jgi:glutamate-1-semialdehyde 2,1-aminomutase
VTARRAGTVRAEELEQRILRRIPGGTQLVSKRPELQAPGSWPRFYSHAKGVQTWDLAGKQYVDMGTTGIGTCVLGFADDDVDGAVRDAIESGSMSSLNCIEDLELADLLCELHPWAEMVRYTRTGGEALTVAVRIARASTRRAVVAFCGYHGWHDWYLAANLATDDALDRHLLPGLDPGGVPAQLRGTAIPFAYGDLGALESVVRSHGSDLAAIVMEPARGRHPEAGYLQGVRELADRAGAVLVFDEVTSGLRVNSGGIHLTYGVNPDIAVLAKALGNGYPMAAVIGIGRVMSAAEGTFISSTYWTERIGPVAAIATLRKHRSHDVGRHLVAIGTLVQEGWRREAAEAKLDVTVGGIPPLSAISFGGEDGQAVATLFTQLMLDEGFLAGRAFYPSFSHQIEHVDAYLASVRRVFSLLSDAVARSEVRKHLKGPVAHAGFKRLV